MLILYLAQSALPLALIGWLAFFPPRSAAGFWAQSIAIGLTLLALNFVGIWIVPPWWTPDALGALLAAAVVGGIARRRASTQWPHGILAWLTFLGFVALGIYAANVTRIAYAATVTPARTVDLASPLATGSYFVANGGAALSVNAHAELLDQTVAKHRPYWGTAHGVDIVALDRWYLRADGLMPADPRRYVIFGRSVIAPCSGKVIVAVDGLPDMQVPRFDSAHLAGNHLILRCASADILLGHFRRGSVHVRVGQSVIVGEAIGQVGNSGNTSEPHLHINPQAPATADAPFSGAPIPIRINGRYLVRNDRFDAQSTGHEGSGQP